MTNYYVHKSAIVDKGAKIGGGSKIWHNVHIMQSARVGDNCVVGQGCFVAGKVGNNCKLQNNVNVYEGVELGDWVFCGPSMTFTNDINPRAKYPKQGNYLSTRVGDGVSIGAHATIVGGVEIGKWAFIGAGSVVTKDVVDYALVFGNPAEVRGWICKCGNKLPKRFTKTVCTKCKRVFQKRLNKVKEVNK